MPQPKKGIVCTIHQAMLELGQPSIHPCCLSPWKASLLNLEDEYGNKLHHDTTGNMENTCEAASLKKKKAQPESLKTTKKLKRIMTQIKQNNNGGETLPSALLFHSSNIHVVC